MTTAYARVGRSGDFGGTYSLTRLVGRSRARELYFTGDTITAAEAQAIGLVDHVHPPEELPAAAHALAERIAAGPPEAIARMKGPSWRPTTATCAPCWA